VNIPTKSSALGALAATLLLCVSVALAQSPPPEPAAPPEAPETTEKWQVIEPPPESASAPRAAAAPAASTAPARAAAPAQSSDDATPAAPESDVGNIWAPTAAPAAVAAPAPDARADASGATLPAVIDARGYMVDLKGMTLYTFDGDTRANSSTCFGVCETLWPPYLAPDDAKAVGEFTIVFRRDGTHQWAYRGKPLYRWARDEKPGDVTGDNVNKVWHLIRN
jgi:predicted lipoprotein with Yx(FWY)xxD motif